MATRMKLLIISYEYPPIGGGVGTALKYYLNALNDIDVDVIFPCQINTRYEKIYEGNITRIPVYVKKNSLFSWTIGEMISWGVGLWLESVSIQKKYDIIHYWGAYPSIMIPLECVRKIPYVITFHGADVPGRHPQFNRIYRISVGYKRYCRRAKCCTAVSKGLCDIAENWLQKQVVYIPNGVYVRSNCYGHEKKLVNMSRLIHWKRIHILINAMKHLPSEYTLDIYGDGPDYIRLYDLARETSDRITLHGWIDKALWKLPEYGIYVNASKDIGVTNIAELDALGFGLPIVRVESQGTSEFSEAVIPVMSTDPLAFAKVIMLVSNNYSMYQQNAIDTAINNSWDIVADKYVDVYKGAI